MVAISFNSDQIEIKMDPCIGCGLCVPKCIHKALILIPLEIQTIPPKLTTRLYLKILEAKMRRLSA